MDDHSKILSEAYEQFLLPLGGKKVPTPYRRNEVGGFQKIGPEFQGKSSPETLTETTKKLAKEQKFDLDKASVKDIRNFMRQNKLGIDCSGFAYRSLNYLVEKIKGKPLTSFGLPHVGRTNVAKLTSEFCQKKEFKQIKPGDILRLNSAGDILHCLVILGVNGSEITYMHSSNETSTNGVHQEKLIIKPGNNIVFNENLGSITYNAKMGDGLFRLKILWS